MNVSSSHKKRPVRAAELCLSEGYAGAAGSRTLTHLGG